MIFKINGKKYNCVNYGTTREGNYVIEIISLYSKETFEMKEFFLFDGKGYSFYRNMYEDYQYIMGGLIEDLNTIRKEDFIEPIKEGNCIKIFSYSKEEYISPGRGRNIKRAIG